MSREVVLVGDHVTAVYTHLEAVLGALSNPVPIQIGERPKKAGDPQFADAPYVVIGITSGGLLDGPLSNTQADADYRIWIACYGNTATEAYTLRDIVQAEMMDKSNFTIPNRVIRDIRMDVPTGGAFRDDDVQTPLFYTREIYVLRTTPA
jgi:hypothetical protein